MRRSISVTVILFALCLYLSTCAALCVGAGTAARAAAKAAVRFYWEEESSPTAVIPEANEGQAIYAPDVSRKLEEGTEAEWRLASRDGEIAEFPYILSRADAEDGGVVFFGRQTVRMLNITVDGVPSLVEYGSALPRPSDTETHRFSGYADEDGTMTDTVVEEKAFTSVFERFAYRVTVLGTDRSEFCIPVGTRAEEEDFLVCGNAFYYDEEMTERAEFPLLPEDDLVLYAVFSDEPVPGTEYGVTVFCEYASCEVGGAYEAGDIVEATVSSVRHGYALEYILVSCGGDAVVAARYGNKAVFTMPTGDVEITVTFTEDGEDYVKKAGLERKEIIAVALTAGALLCAGVAAVIIKKKKR